MTRTPFVVAAAALSLLDCSSTPPAAAPAATTSLPSAPASTAAAAPAEPATVDLDGGCDAAAVAYAKECAKKRDKCKDPHPSSHPGPDAYGAVLNQGSYLVVCRAPAAMAVKVCAAVREGHAVGVTVETSPGDRAVATCIGEAVKALSYPSGPGLDVTSTTFDAQ